MITVKELTKRYAGTAALDQISFQVAIVGFLVPNGAGKTTTMRMLTWFLPPSAGTANVAGFDVLEQPFEVKKRIGYLPETPPIYPEMSRFFSRRRSSERFPLDGPASCHFTEQLQLSYSSAP
jgi:ABC-2 type transport system ATP-binding protein